MPASGKEDKRLEKGKSSTYADRSHTILQSEHKSVIETNIQYHFDSICHNLRNYLGGKGVIVVDMNTAVIEHTELLEKYLGMITPPEDNRNAALNGALWSSGSFIYVPPNVRIDFLIYLNYSNNESTTNQFERNVIIADEGAEVHYIEGSALPTQTHVEGSIHSLVTELVANKYSTIRYTTLQNWSKDVYNLASKRAHVYENAAIDWIGGNIGSKLTRDYSSVYLLGRNAFAEIALLAFAGFNQHQDISMQTVHLAPRTRAKIFSKSINKSDGKTTFKGLLHVKKGAIGAKTDVQFDALVLDGSSGVNTYPCLEVNEENSVSSYDAVVRKVGIDQIFYLMSRGYSKCDAISLIGSVFVEPFLKQLSPEFAVELRRLIQHKMEEGIYSHIQDD
jgi:Fe-S cluster assembly protein SufB